MRKMKIDRTVLQNGLRVITIERDSEVFSMGVGIKAGSLYEGRQNNGISHLIEHMLFKGTAKRTVEQLNDDVEKLAGDLDIYTTYIDTVMTVSILKDRAQDCLELVSDMLQNATFPNKELTLEKKVIIEEIKMAKDDAEDVAYLGLYKAAFPDEWHKFNIAGTTNSVKSIKVKDLEEFYKAYYIPRNAVVCIVSSFTHQEIVSLMEKYFGMWQGEKAQLNLRQSPMVKNKNVKGYKKGLGQTHVIYGFDINGLTREEDAALSIINKKLGAGANSILFKELREKKGLAYSIYSDMDYMENIRLFYIYAGISGENLKSTLKIIDEVLEKFKNDDSLIDEKSLKLLKDIFITDVVIAEETPADMIDYLLDGELTYNDPMEYRNMLEKIERVTKEDIKRVVNKIFKDPIVYILNPK
ncbi:putative zinc protease AlbF [Oxobacter pfennigii]|uniref:Putative zinc protease AlbF n=1 Tax=Oxobacter pfennigii TaxID=36849 RepID=A0A0P8WYY9_9CLOT|nr:pitrilysin family protein [Oxobacter pfennigii]KPU43652.1 putative zinc protease AlbF [Oxobacter pfennigii]